MSALPTGVTLQQIDGGPNYYANNGLTNAVNMGWDNPSFFPIGPWFDMLNTQSDANRWANLGWNTAYTLTSNSNISVAQANNISVIQYIGDNGASSLLPGTGAETVGLMAYDEPSTYQQGVVTPLSTTPNSVQDGRFWWMNNTWNFIVYGGLSGGPDGGGTAGSAAVLDTPVTTPDGTTRHIDTSSVDVYWFAGAKSNSSAVLYWEGMMYGQGEYDGLLPGTPTWSPLTPDQGARGSNYGTQIDLERAYTGGSTPIDAIIEDGGPYTSDTSASTYITPPELNWAVWSSLIHGARGVVYFNHTFAGPAQSDDNLADPYFQTVQPGQTVSMYTQVQNTDALVEQMAPVLNSPTADGYVTVSDPGYENGVTVSDFSGIEVTAKDDNGQFYILSDTRDSETQTNIPATFTLADKNATSVTVIGENRTIPVTNGVFTDTFATGASVHIYEVNDGSAASPATVTRISDSPATGDLNAGKTVALTLNFSQAVTVAGGAPTLTLNDGGTATYASGSSTNALTFNYTVTAGQNAASLAATGVNLANGVTITDGAGNAANLSLSSVAQTGPRIDTATPAVTSASASPATGTEDVGNTITFTVNMSEAVTVAGGTPTLALNDGGTATYSSGSGTDALTFSYTVKSTDHSVSSLAIKAVNLPSGVTIADGAGNAAKMAGALVKFTRLSVDTPVTVAGYLANRGALDAAGHIAIADTTSNVSASFDRLNADPNVASITLSAAGTPTLSLSVAQALNDTHALSAITNASYAIAVAETAANISANIDALNANSHLASVTLTNAGTPTLTLTVAEALNGTADLAKIKSNYTITVSDTAGNIENLTSAQIASLGSLHVSRLSASDARVVLTVAQAVGLENNSIPVPAASGLGVSVSDTAARPQSLSAPQIAGLSSIIWAARLQSNNANVTFSASQTSAILSAHLSVSAAGTYSVTEKFTSGAVISSSQGSNGGALTLSTNANGLTIDAGASTLSVTAESETIPLHYSANETINATNRTNDTFVFAPEFGNDTILGFAASGANHDTLVFNTAMFSYLSPGMSPAHDLAQVLLHATSSGGMTTISDTLGDILTLGAVNIATLSAHPADFKFVS